MEEHDLGGPKQLLELGLLFGGQAFQGVADTR